MGSNPIGPTNLPPSVMWTTYILYSPSLDRHYVGQTSDLGSRLRHHASGSTEFTAQTTDWLLVFAEELPDQVHAMRLEQQIKRAKSRASIARYVKDTRNTVRVPRPMEDW